MWIGGPDWRGPELMYETDELLVEAPNWYSTGHLYLNGNGGSGASTSWAGGGLDRGRSRGCPPLNNDHVLDPDGHHVYLSAMDGHIYRAALAGGEVSG